LFLLRELGTKAMVAFAVALGFALSPPTLLFERSFTDTYPAAVLVALSAALLYRAWKEPSVAAWLWFFSACATLGLLRSTFHLIWLVAVLTGTVGLQKRDARADVLRGALGPLLVLLGLYLKNLALFGLFAPGSHSAFAHHALTNRVAAAEKAAFLERGVLSPLAALPVYAPPRAYEPYFVAPPPWSPALLTSYDRPTIGTPNYNHRFLLDAEHVARKDALNAIRERPLRYVALVAQTVGTFLGPSTRYHPHDKSERSPHASHRRLLGGYETLYETVVHRFPFRPVGLYVLLPLSLTWAFRRARSLAREGRPSERAKAAVLFYSVFTVVFIASATMPFASTEAARFRYAVEPLIWLLVTLSLAPVLGPLLTRLRARSAPESGRP
jgi:hypothetical protein